jgi:hypothetical protein
MVSTLRAQHAAKATIGRRGSLFKSSVVHWVLTTIASKTGVTDD